MDFAPVDVLDSLATASGYFKASNTNVSDRFGGDQASNPANAVGAIYLY